MRPAFKLVAFLAALFLMASWAGGITIPGWDDGQSTGFRSSAVAERS